MPTPNAKTPTGIKRSDHLLPPPYTPMDSMTSGQPSSSVLGGAQILRLPPNPRKHVPSTRAADRVLHDEPTSGIRRGSTRYLHDGDNIGSLAPDVRQRSQVNQPHTKSMMGIDLQCLVVIMVIDDLTITHLQLTTLGDPSLCLPVIVVMWCRPLMIVSPRRSSFSMFQDNTRDINLAMYGSIRCQIM